MDLGASRFPLSLFADRPHFRARGDGRPARPPVRLARARRGGEDASDPGISRAPSDRSRRRPSSRRVGMAAFVANPVVVRVQRGGGCVRARARRSSGGGSRRSSGGETVRGGAAGKRSGPRRFGNAASVQTTHLTVSDLRKPQPWRSFRGDFPRRSTRCRGRRTKRDEGWTATCTSSSGIT